MSERDPRIDPVDGDVVRGAPSGMYGCCTRRVTLTRPMFGGIAVRYREEDGALLRWGGCMLATWRKWAAGAEIVKRGEP
jgi:hypothetical protein